MADMTYAVNNHRFFIHICETGDLDAIQLADDKPNIQNDLMTPLKLSKYFRINY